MAKRRRRKPKPVVVKPEDKPKVLKMIKDGMLPNVRLDKEFPLKIMDLK